jgi:hypothetical protein
LACGLGLYPLAMVPAGFAPRRRGDRHYGLEVTLGSSGRRWRSQLPGSACARRRDRAVIGSNTMLHRRPENRKSRKRNRRRRRRQPDHRIVRPAAATSTRPIADGIAPPSVARPRGQLIALNGNADPLAILRLMPPGRGPVPHILAGTIRKFFPFGMTMSMNLP